MHASKKKIKPPEVEVQESIDKTAKQFFLSNGSPGIRLNAKCNPIGPNKLLQSS